MGLVRNQLSRRFRTLAAVSDVAVIATTGRRMAQRTRSGGKAGVGELLLVTGAVLRILRRSRRRRNGSVRP